MKSRLYIISAILLLFACKKGMDAHTYLENARRFYENADYESAKKMLDSLKVFYPKDFEIQKKGLQLSRLVELKQQALNLRVCDSLLRIRLLQRDSMMTTFIFEKNPEYDEIGRYYDKSQILENNLEHSHIRSGVNELGIMELSSVYYGKEPIRHTGLKVTNLKGEYTETEAIPYDGGMNYSFTDSNKVTEVVTYLNGKDNGVILFIYNNMKTTLKARYTGGANKEYDLVISQSDKNAMAKTFDFSVVLSDIEKLHKEKEKTSNRIAYLQGKITEK